MVKGVLARRRLLDILDRRDFGVCVISAPSGFGKTTLLRNWADFTRSDDLSGPVVWVALSAEVSSRLGFWQSVVVGAGRHGHLQPQTRAALNDAVEAAEDPLVPIETFLDEAGPVTIVLDAYEHLRDLTPVIDADLLRLTDRLPQLCFMVTTRAGSRLRSSALHLRGRVRFITEDELRFTPEETGDLLGVHLRRSGADVARRIHRDTRGYPLGIRAVALALADRPTTPVPGSAEWRELVTEDLKSQLADPRTIEFIRATCVPPYFDLDLARTLAGGEDAEALLADLEWNGFGRWIPYARHRPAFQYVDSVREVFLNDLRRDETYTRTAAVAAKWLHHNADHELALGLAIGARQYALASRITRSLIITSPESYTSDRLGTHLRQVPASVLPRFPALAFALGLAYLSHPATRGSAGEHFRTVSLHAVSDLGGLTPAEIFFHHGMRALSLRFIGRFADSGTAADLALDYFDSLSAAQRDELSEFTALAMRQLAYSFFQAGQVERARSVVTRAVASATAAWSRNYTLVYGVGINAIDGRGLLARSTLDLVDPQAWPRDHERSYLNAMGRVGAAVLKLDDFDPAGAVQEFTNSESFLHTSEFWPYINWALMNARLLLDEAGTEAARIEDALGSTPIPPGVGANLGTAALQNMLAISWLAVGRSPKAAAVLESAADCPGQLAPARMLKLLVAGDSSTALHLLPRLTGLRGHTIRSRASLFTFGAVASLREGNRETASSLLERAAALYSAGGARVHLAYVPAEDLRSLRALADGSGNSSSIGYLEQPVLSPLTTAGQVLGLTEREREVLHSFVGNRTQNDAAAALFVSTNTLKTQLRRIYRKLGVSSRAEAIQRALELDLLDPSQFRK